MHNIIKNVWRILLKRKGYLLAAIVFPVVATMFIAGLYTNSSTYPVGIVNKDKGVLGSEVSKNLDALKSVEVKELDAKDNNINKLVFNEVFMVITIEEDFTEKLMKGEKSEIKFNATNKDEMTEVVKSVLNSEVKSLATICNNIDVEKVGMEKVLEKYNSSIPEYKMMVERSEKGVNILATVGIMLYLMFISAGMASSILIEDEQHGTRDRILMGKVSEKEYYLAMGCVLFILTSIPAIEYYVICKVLKHNIGFQNDLIFLALVLLIVLFAIAFTIMITTIIKNKAIHGVITATLTIPMFMLSGAFWEFSMMGEGLQKVGSIFPIRWFTSAIEKMQNNGTIIDILPNILGIVVITVVLFILSIFFTKNKIVLVKDN